mgnify:CR=1 FL=1|tara:strand:- start:3037 stop:3909 length:873 start_codon:yes stop_codon:yes gene_type:complete
MIVCLIAINLVGCALKKPNNWVAKVNSTYITENDINNSLKQYPEETQKQLQSNKSMIISQLVNQELLFQEAKKEGIENQEEYISQIKQLEEQLENAKRQLLTNFLINQKILTNISVDENEIKTFYNENKTQFNAYEQRKARHILVKTEQEALNIYNKAINKKDFSKLAKKYSIDPTSENGGDLGWFKKGQLVPEFEKSVFNLPRKGSISKVVQTTFGYHIIKLDDIQKVSAKTLEESQTQIKTFLYNQKQSVALQKYIEKIKNHHKVNLKSDDKVADSNKKNNNEKQKNN